MKSILFISQVPLKIEVKLKRRLKYTWIHQKSLTLTFVDNYGVLGRFDKTTQKSKIPIIKFTPFFKVKPLNTKVRVSNII